MNTEVLVSLFEIELTAIAPYVLQSCLLVPPVPTPEPEPENVISTPVPPGIEYEALPVIDTETQIIDTSPDQLIGCANELPTGGEQQILNSLFPGAIDGDGVVNRDNNDIWTYNGSVWANVGPTPGPQLVVVSVLPPWNEIVIVLGLIKAKISVKSLNYALEITTEAGAVAVKTKVTVKAVRFAQAPLVDLTIEAFAPGFGSSTKVFGKVVDVVYYDGTDDIPQQLATQWPASMMLLYSQFSNWLWFDKSRGNRAWGPGSGADYDISLQSYPGSISFGENGVTVQGGDVNEEFTSYRAYIFKGKQEAIANTAGSRPTTIYESDAFNIITYTGNAAVSTIGHGLGEVPALLIFKSPTDFGVTGGSFIRAGYFVSMGGDSIRNTSSSVITGFTDSIVNIGTSSVVNASDALITCYAFKQKQDQCKIGTYYGNGLPGGQVIDCGFNIGVVLIKSLTATGRWTLLNDKDSDQGFRTPSWRTNSDNVSSERHYEFSGNNFTVYSNSSALSDLHKLNRVGVEYLYMALAVGFYRKLNCPSANIIFQAYAPVTSVGTAVQTIATGVNLLAVPPPYAGKRATIAAVARTGIRLQSLQATINAGVNISPLVSEFEFKASVIPYAGEAAEDGFTYIAIVESRDGQPLEDSAKGCIYGLIKDLKAANLWDKFLTIVPMCVAKTLNGAMVPLAGRYPSFGGTVSDYSYNRRTGLRPTTSTGNSYVATNLNSIDLPAVDNHMAAYVTALNDSSLGSGGDLIGDGFGTNGMALGRVTSGSGFQTRNKNSTTTTSVAPFWSQPSIAGVTRQNSSSYILRLADVDRTIASSIADQLVSPNYNPIRLFYFWNGLGNYRVPFYSIGMGLDLAVLEGIIETFLERLRLIGLPDKRILVPYKNLQIQALKPLYTGLRGVKPSASEQLISTGTVTINTGVAVSVSSASIVIGLLDNIYAGQERTVVLSPSVSISVEYFAPSVSGGASVTTQFLSYSMTAIAPARTDSNAFAYIAAVEAADGQSLEADVKLSINNFIVGCKADGIWSAIKASCILAGARTLNGAFVPLAGTAPSNFNFWGDADPSWTNVSLLLRMNGANASTAFTDSSSNALTVTPNGNVQMSTAQTKFGVSSGLFDGTGDYLSFAYSAALDLIGSAFTAETWIRPTAYKTSGARIMAAGGGTAAWNSTNGIHFLVQLGSDGRLNLQSWTGSAVQSQYTTAAIPLSTWSHIAVSVSGTNVYLAINGVVQAFTASALVRPSTNPIFTVATINGEAGAVGTAFVGNLDDFRITKGVARYTANFIPRTQTFPGSTTDYNRKTGLLGDGGSKYLNSNRNNNADPQNSKHLAIYARTTTTTLNQMYAGVTYGTGFTALNTLNSTTVNCCINDSVSSVGVSNSIGFIGANRSGASAQQARGGGVTNSNTQASQTPRNENIALLSTPTRVAFYSIGESVNLALLDTRVTRLLNEVEFSLNTGLSGTSYDIDTLKYINAGYAAGGSLG